jgi:hypothetical protein
MTPGGVDPGRQARTGHQRRFRNKAEYRPVPRKFNRNVHLLRVIARVMYVTEFFK